ncbi:MAG: hypothetical protein HND59_08380 [Pseudomonadota bacterium]|nr:MAG: hypothetical protein HND59_08380 [Pseudomonadota bacterium]
MISFIIVTGCIGFGIFIGMVLSAAFSTDTGQQVPQIAQVLPTKQCYECHRYSERLDRAV